MYKLTFFLAIASLSLHAIATPIAQEAPPQHTPAPTQPPQYCAPLGDCAQIDLNNAFPVHIDDIGAYLESFGRYCNSSRNICWVDIVTKGSCQVSLGWFGDLNRYKGNAVDGATYRDRAKQYIGPSGLSPNCAGGVDTVVNGYGNVYVGVKVVGYDLL
jgi:hypothetical protein